MKKKSLLVVLTLLTGAVFAGASARAAGHDFYVSPKGSDRNPGTKERPFQTLEGARDAVRRVNRKVDGDIVVHFAGGTYELEKPVEFTPTDSGMNGHRIIYQAYEDHEPVFSGAIKVTEWKPLNDTVWQASLNHNQKLRSLFVDGKRAYMASKTAEAKGGWGEYKVRKGQADWAWESGSTIDGILFDENEIPDLKNPEEVEVWRNSKFNSHIVGIRDVSSEGDNRVLEFQQPYGAIALHIKYGRLHPKGGATVYNAFEFLDEPGEFYFDRKKKTLYYIPRAGEDMAATEVYAPVNGQLISIQGKSKTERVSNLTFKGLTFANTEAVLPEVDGSVGKSTVQAATWVMAFDEPDWHTTAYRAYDTMPNAVTVSSAQFILFADNIFKHIGNEGIGYINDVTDSEIVGNLIYDVGGSAIQVGHPQHVYEGDTHEHARYPADEEGVCRNILVENNVLYDMTTMFYGHAPITAYFVDGLRILKNHIQKCNYTAVSVGWGWNNFDAESVPGNPTTTCKNNMFNNNRVYDCMNMLHDGGAYYTLGSQPNSTADGNYVKAATRHFQGVYHMDEGTSGYTGTDMVIEVQPDQNIAELNKWRRKNNIHFSNIYTTSDRLTLGAPNCTVTNKHVIEDANWPEEALAIIRAAGVEEEYEDLLNVIPDMTFDTAKRYDTTWPVITPEMIALINQASESTDGRYEAEQAKVSGGAKVAKKHRGFSGDGFVEGFYESDTGKVTFKIDSENMGTSKITLRYAAGHGDSSNIAVYVNGEKSEMLKLKSTGGWTNWDSHVFSAFFEAGMNTISFKSESKSIDSINIDYIQITN
ncbi:CBM35 domain-containing protein [Pontiellaceae bacterium B1224]|nr:CBM35 domain-containing protein [Pontiellaceae bacterium B1224]